MASLGHTTNSDYIRTSCMALCQPLLTSVKVYSAYTLPYIVRRPFYLLRPFSHTLAYRSLPQYSAYNSMARSFTGSSRVYLFSSISLAIPPLLCHFCSFHLPLFLCSAFLPPSLFFLSRFTFLALFLLLSLSRSIPPDIFALRSLSFSICLDCSRLLFSLASCLFSFRLFSSFISSVGLQTSPVIHISMFTSKVSCRLLRPCVQFLIHALVHNLQSPRPRQLRQEQKICADRDWKSQSSRESSIGTNSSLLEHRGHRSFSQPRTCRPCTRRSFKKIL